MKIETQLLVGNNLRLTRQIRGFTQKYVADSTGISLSLYSAYEKGSRSQDAESLFKISNIYSVEMELFFAPDTESLLNLFQTQLFRYCSMDELYQNYKDLSPFNQGRLVQYSKELASFDSETKSLRNKIASKK